MNNNILEFLSKWDKFNTPNLLLPHQVATLDYLFRKCVHENENVLLYHKMGSGKTILCLTFALMVSAKNKVLIIVPNNTIVNIWQSSVEKCINILPFLEYTLSNISIKTRVKFVEEVNNYNEDIMNKIKMYDDHYIIIDEAHNFFGNNSGINIIKIKQSIEARFILLTGSPISNTIEPLKNILTIINKNTTFDNRYINKGKKVYEITLNNEGRKFVTNELRGRVTFYDQESSNIPQVYYKGYSLISYPVIFCRMSRLQSEYYNKVLKELDNNTDIFSKSLMNASFCVLGDPKNYTHFNNLIGTTKELLPNLTLSGNILKGKALETLDISAKFKYFRDRYIINAESTKKFVYFANSKIGSLVIRSIMSNLGLTEWDKDIVNKPRCTRCGLRNKCKEKGSLCKYMKYAIITSTELNTNTNIINIILDKFNSPSNDEGDEIMFLFGSKIISEAYTLTEVMSIIFLTVPDTKTELTQIVSRALRSFSYKDVNKGEVEIKILVAIREKSDISMFLKNNKETRHEESSINQTKESITRFVDIVNEDKLDYDVKKMFYLEIKSERSDILLKIFKNSHQGYREPPVPELERIVFYETLKRIFYKDVSAENIRDYFIMSNDKYIMAQNKIKDFSKELENGDSVIYNKKFKNSIILFFKNYFHLIPIRLRQDKYLMSIPVTDLRD